MNIYVTLLMFFWHPMGTPLHFCLKQPKTLPRNGNFSIVPYPCVAFTYVQYMS